MRIGVLALQGAFAEHRFALEALGAEATEVRRAADLTGLDGLVIPGGESTTMRLLMLDYRLKAALCEKLSSGLPVLGTCAGLIVLARTVDGVAGVGLDALDVSVRRNAFGRQVDSFEQDLSVPMLGERPFPGVFIRAPIIEAAEPSVEVLAVLPEGPIVAVRQAAVVGLAFHPELTPDRRFHAFFLDIVAGRGTEPTGSSDVELATEAAEVRG